MEQSGGRSVPTSRMSGNTAQPTDQPQGAVAAAAVKPVLDTLSQALVNRLQGQDVLRSLEGRKDAIVVSLATTSLVCQFCEPDCPSLGVRRGANG